MKPIQQSTPCDGFVEERPLDSSLEMATMRYGVLWLCGRHLAIQDGSLSLMEVDGMEDTFAACIALGRGLGFEEAHSRQDARLAVRLFDLSQDLHGLGEEYRGLLYCAGLLHDIGYVEGYWGHHKTAYRLIMKAELPGLTEREKQIVANVARYHRGARPKLSHTGFAALAPDDREIVTKLSAILRLVDGLDRTHTDAAQGLEVDREGDRFLVLVDCPFGCDAEIWAGERKGRFFAEVFGVHVQVRQHPSARSSGSIANSPFLW